MDLFFFLSLLWFVDGRKLCTGSRDNWMCLWDIESAKCEQRHNISRNLVRIIVCAHSPGVQRIVLKHALGVCVRERIKSISHSALFSGRVRALQAVNLQFPSFSVQVTHVCWVPGSSSVVQTSEDKTIRYVKT